MGVTSIPAPPVGPPPPPPPEPSDGSEGSESHGTQAPGEVDHPIIPWESCGNPMEIPWESYKFRWKFPWNAIPESFDPSSKFLGGI